MQRAALVFGLTYSIRLDTVAVDMTATSTHPRETDPYGSKPFDPRSSVAVRIANAYWNCTGSFEPGNARPGGLIETMFARHKDAILKANPNPNARSTTTAIVDRLNNAMDRAKSALGIGTPKATATPATASTARPVAAPAPVAAKADLLAGMSAEDRQEIAR